MAWLVALCGLLGLLVGSFLNVVIYRVPRGQSILHPRSRCPECETEIRPFDNVPVVSWLVLRGKCRNCASPISPRYPIVELATAVLFVLAGWHFGLDWVLPAYLVFFASLVAVTMIDLDTRRIPDKIVFPTLAACAVLLASAAIVDDTTGALARAAIGSALAFTGLFVVKLIQPGGMGFGDVKLALLLGLALGYLGLGFVALGLFLGFFSGAVVGLGLMATGRGGRKTKLPFGPFLALGAVLAILAGSPILNWYSGV